MKHAFDMKSLALGLVLGVGGMAIMGLTTPEAGRYQISSSDQTAYVIDTATGQVWPKDAGQSGPLLTEFLSAKLK